MKALVTLAIAAFASLADAKEPKPLILYRIGDVPVEMCQGDEFGVMLVNDGNEDAPSPRYILAILSTRTVIDTKDSELFKTLLKRIPKGSTVFEYVSCTVPRSWGLTDEHLSIFESAFKDSGLIISEVPRITCYCESVTK